MTEPGDELAPALVHHLVNSLGWRELRPLQRASIVPLVAGHDALLLAPTAGGKTEAAVFPVLTLMVDQGWTGLSVLYVCPLRALLNNLLPRIEQYASWVGRRTALWHGDTSPGERGRIRTDPPDILLTTPESIEAMLVSTLVSEREFFAGVQAVVIDEIHAFAGDDRGWHLLAVLDRLEHITGRPLQRIGLSATVGNPEMLLKWLQGAQAGERPAKLIAPGVVTSGPPAAADITLDHVGGLAGAATVIAGLHAGEKRLVFCESRRAAEDLALGLREQGVTTFVSHSSLSRDERSRAEHAFAEARDCVIVATSTLELGVDVGDLDRMIQIDAPRTVASFLQRLGRTGRREGAVRNALFLTTRPESFLQAAGLLHLWGSGFVEPIEPVPRPWHIAAQQILALCLEQGAVTRSELLGRWGVQRLAGDHAERILDHLESAGHLARDGELLFIGEEAERRFGRRHFMELVSVFTSAPEFRVLHGRTELGSVDPFVLTRAVTGPRIVVLAGRSWRVTHIDWRRRRCFVEGWEQGASMRWSGDTPPVSYEVGQAQRAVLLGADPPVQLSKRAIVALADVRAMHRDHVRPDALVVERGGDAWWWTWAGARANATLIASIQGVADPAQRIDNYRVRLLAGVPLNAITDAKEIAASKGLSFPEPSRAGIDGLKFADLLTRKAAASIVSTRMADELGAGLVMSSDNVHVHW